MRQMNALPYCAVPAEVKPAACSACSPFAGSPGAQPRSTLPPAKCVKSTITVTPDVALQPDAGVAPAIAGEAIADDRDDRDRRADDCLHGVVVPARPVNMA
jgi:hypothetical protein